MQAGNRPVRGIRADHEDGAVRKVEKPDGAPDQRQAKRHKPVDRAEENASPNRLDYLGVMHGSPEIALEQRLVVEKLLRRPLTDQHPRLQEVDAVGQSGDVVRVLVCE